MTSMAFRTGYVATCGLAIALSGVACENRNVAQDLSRIGGHEGTEITLAGCLQKGPGRNNFILTEVNQPSALVGTSGSADQSAVEREQMRSAKHAYRLDGDSDSLENLVGKQVRVFGILTELSDLNRPRTRIDRPIGTSGDKEDLGLAQRDRMNRGPQDIDQDDLAEVAVKSVEKIAEVCGAIGQDR